MLDTDKIKGIIFDYGGTIDSNGKHWAEVLWNAYQEQLVPVTKEQFREAYVYAERYLATNKVIEAEDNFFLLLCKKVNLQINYLVENLFLFKNEETNKYSLAISTQCYNFAKDLISKEKPLLDELKSRYPMVLVSNFYGNVQAVLSDFGLLDYFNDIIESAVVGVRKPNPAIFSLGVESLDMPASSVVIIGDSYSKDIVPANKIGCQTIWLKGIGWEEESVSATADLIIKDFMELKSAFQLG
ncbi:HAD family hydrolase [Dysgonomonas sp. Marseille-P4677]|uniref:HAD family hydrolase n=1 Tax=Dysgonomonas sp. Marseille-P4677 TaxID=2364790 RepID=UPI001913140D|nr:HAD family hydrolase [Dysgonomonas sp. Marseille-P4677]MBK5722076.1 HAD family hydrolase [Dysgonomonas sp. Marseille-P4677]